MEEEYNQLDFADKQDATDGVYDSTTHGGTQTKAGAGYGNTTLNNQPAIPSTNVSSTQRGKNVCFTKTTISILGAFLIAIVGLILGIISFTQIQQYNELERITVEVRNLLLQNKAQLNTLEQTQSETPYVNPPKSCDYINGTANQSGFYVISPDSSIVSPFFVYCNFNGTATETIISHDSTNETSVTKCYPRRCYTRKISYDVTILQAISLIEESQNCRQFIKYRCVGSILFRNGNPTYAAWLSRDGSAQIYWGGATSRRDRYCACGETDSCVDNRWHCNCDTYSNNLETSDEGYLTDKNKLPVTELQFGDTGQIREQGWHTLGPLICSGRRSQ